MTTTTATPDIALPPGATFADIWQPDRTRWVSTEVGTLQLSADPLKNPIVNAMAEQHHSGRIGAVEIAVDDIAMGAEQARELAALLNAAADQVDKWCGCGDAQGPAMSESPGLPGLLADALRYVRYALEDISDYQSGAASPAAVSAAQNHLHKALTQIDAVQR